MGRLGPPTQSLNCFGVWPYVVSFECCVRPFRQVALVKASLQEKPYGSASDVDDASTLPSPPLSSPTLSQVEVTVAFRPFQSFHRPPLSPRAPVLRIHPVLSVRRYRPRGSRNLWSNARAGSKGGVSGSHSQQTRVGTV